ncbi:MAG: DUF2207 domain-containing protein, partial [Mailhella sp.]|nr:DUF2207 domain-containing protein [Mailhella sp.]
MRRFLAVLLFFFLLAAECGAVPIHVQSFDAAVDVGSDGVITVEEKLLVRTVPGGHGIFRDIPVVTRWREQGRAAMDILSVTLDGAPRPVDDVERNGNIVRVYQRDKEKALEPGVHEFVLKYAMTGQIGMFENNDELTWNVTGHDWEQPIEKASCIVYCPRGAGFFGQKAWHDRHGGKKSGAVSMDRREENGRQVLHFATAGPILPGQELTVAAGWEKGFVSLPEGTWNLNTAATAILSALCALLAAYFSIVWYFFGRDPQKGVIVPLFHPPLTTLGQENKNPGPISPAGVCYLHYKAGFSPKCFGVALISLASRGICSVSGNARQGFLLRREEGLSPYKEENALLRHLPKNEMPVDRKHGEELSDMRSSMMAQLRSDYRGVWKGSHDMGLIAGLFGSGWTVLGAVVAFAGIISVAGLLDSELIPALAGDFAILLGMFFFVSKFLGLLVSRWKARSYFSCGILAFFCVPLVVVLFGGLLFAVGEELIASFTAAELILMLVAALIPMAFSLIMDAPTKETRSLLDKVEGLAMYIGMAERDRLNLINPPELTAEHFQEIMPYAVALGLEEAWGSRFTEALDVSAVRSRDLMLACS